MASEEEDHQKTTLLLPQEIILTEIASRLPVKSLSQFKSVSKPWLTFISHPNFAKLHLKRTQKLRILLASRSVYSTDPQPENNSRRRLLARELNYPLKNRHDGSVQIFGSCNGLVCMSPTSLESSFPFFIYNPTTGESKEVPQFQTPRPLFAAPDIYGFGYSPSIDDYKFVKVAHGQMVQVYSLKTDTWKRAEDFPYNAPYYEPGTPLNGSIHWVQSRGTLANHSWAVLAPAFVEVKMIDVPQPEEQSRLNYSCVIAAFDLSEEKFVDLPMPNSEMDFRRYALGVLGEWLCTMHHYDMVHNEFWVMKEYGVKESWTRIMINVGYGTLRPLCFVGDGGNKALMVLNQERLVELNVEDGTCVDLEVGNMRDHDYESDVFVESLVSPISIVLQGELCN